MRRVALGVAVLLGLGTSVPASAMTLPGPPPSPVPAPEPPAATPPVSPSALSPRSLRFARPDGRPIRVIWPARQRDVVQLPGSRLTVRVTQPRRRAQRLTVSLVRVSSRGRILRSVKRARVSRGKVAVVVPPGHGRRYLLRIARGAKLLRRLTVRTPRAPVAPSTPPARRDGVAPPIGCGFGTIAGQIELPSTVVVPGERVPFSVLNTGTACFGPLAVAGLHRREADAWVPVAAITYPVVAMYYNVPVGARDRSAFGVPEGAPAGEYRLTVRLSSPVMPGPAPDPPVATTVSATFVVTAAPEPALP